MENILYQQLRSKTLSTCEIYYFKNNSMIIGSGSYGYVCYGAMRNNKKERFRLIAVKVIETENVKSIADEKDPEIEALRDLSESDGVVTIFDVIVEEKDNQYNNKIFCTKFLLLELGAYGTLDDMVKENSLSDLEIRHLFLGLARALKDFHHKKILHRDIKGNNVIFVVDVPKFVDLGQAKKLSPENELAKTYTGTINYINPQILRKVDYSYEGDIFSLGVTLYKMYFRRLPFYATKDNERNPTARSPEQFLNLYETTLGEKNIDKIFTNDAYIDENGRDLLKGMLNLDDKKRFSLEGILSHPYFHFKISGLGPKKIKVRIPKINKEQLNFLTKEKNKLKEELYEAFNFERKKQMAFKVLNRIEFERRKAHFINKVLSNLTKLAPMLTLEQFCPLVVSLSYLNFLHITIFCDIVEENKKPIKIAKGEAWKAFYELEAGNELIKIKDAMDTIGKNYQNMSANIQAETVGEGYRKMLKFDKKDRDFNIFQKLEEAAIEVFKTIIPKFESFNNDPKTLDFIVEVLYDLLLIMTMGVTLNFGKLGKFINFERYREIKRIPGHNEIMKERVMMFFEQVINNEPNKDSKKKSQKKK